MNEQPKSIWRKPWQGWRGALLWFALLAAAAFVVIYCIGLIAGNDLGLLLAALVSSLCIALAILFIRWLCNRRNFRRFLFGVACVITLIALFYVEENWRGRRVWEKHRRVWEAKGEKFTIAALVPPLVPDEKNFALTPLLKPVLEFTHGSNGIVWLDTNGMARLDKVHADVSMPKQTYSLVFGSLDKGTMADLEACRNFYRGNTNYPQPVQSGTAAEDILVALGKFDPEIKELREAAATRPYSRFPVNYDGEPSWGILLPHLANVKKLCVLTEARAIARLGLGQSAEALEELKVGFRLSNSIRDEPILINHLVRIATLTLDLRVVHEGLARHAWSDAQLVELEKYLALVNLLAEYKFAMRGERALNVSGLDYIRRRGFWTSIGTYFAGENGIGEFSSRFNPVPSGFFYQNMLTISRMHQYFILPAVDENAHRVFPEFAERMSNACEALAEKRHHPYKFVAALLMPALNKAIIKSARSQTYVGAARVACALERHRLAHGNFPETLAALAPQFMEKIPHDVIGGKPLKYRRTDDGQFILYSVGWNETDDGGKIAFTKDGKALDQKQGDWVWRYPEK